MHTHTHTHTHTRTRTGTGCLQADPVGEQRMDHTLHKSMWGVLFPCVCVYVHVCVCCVHIHCVNVCVCLCVCALSAKLQGVILFSASRSVMAPVEAELLQAEHLPPTPPTPIPQKSLLKQRAIIPQGKSQKLTVQCRLISL